MKPFLIITGMHRSGTSFLARALNLCGVYLGPPEDFISNEWRPAKDNLRGHWENKHIIKLSQETLSFNNTLWDEPKIKLGINKEIGTKLEKISQELCNNHFAAAGFKDPRIILFFESWLNFLPKNILVIGIFRHPLKVAESLKKRDGFSYEKSLNLWKVYNDQLLEILSVHNGFLLNFDEPKDILFKEINFIAKKIGLLDVDLSDWFSTELLHSDTTYDVNYSLPDDVKLTFEKLKAQAKKNHQINLKSFDIKEEVYETAKKLMEELNYEQEFFNKLCENPMGALLYVYLKRKDLQDRFPEVKKGDYRGLLEWSIKFGLNEEESIILNSFKKQYQESLEILRLSQDSDKNEKEMKKTIEKIKQQEKEMSEKNRMLEKLQSGVMDLQEKLMEKNTKLHRIELELEQINSSIIFVQVRNFLRWMDKRFPPNTKSGKTLQRTRSAYYIIMRRGFSALIKTKKGNYVKNEKNIQSNQFSSDDGALFLGIDTELNTQDFQNKTILIKGWCFNDKLKIKQVYINVGGFKQKVSNYGIPRMDVFNEHGYPNSINCGFWTVFTLPDTQQGENSDMFLEIMLENHKQQKVKLATLRPRHERIQH